MRTKLTAVTPDELKQLDPGTFALWEKRWGVGANSSFTKERP